MSKKLPKAITLLELISLSEDRTINRLEDIPVLQNWEASRRAENAAWPRVMLGVTSGQKPREIRFSAEHDGVHGMIAGTTGSGKSELLLTLILNLALHYDPSVLNFCLIDYQGGVAFEPFRSLPHVIDLVTSMQGVSAMRSFIALRAELARRSQIITESHVKNIVQYRRKNLHVTREPLPHLFVVIDEFAEMIRDMPEAGKHLDSIARLGRALGVHLILATQRPSGVVSEQIRANMGFRMCLRVQAPEDSHALLHQPDAAWLPANAPGRGYLETDGKLTLMQTAYSGGVYLPNDADDVPKIDAPPLYEAITAYISELAGVRRPIKPWPDPLSLRLALDTQPTEPALPLPLNSHIIAWNQSHGGWSAVNWEQGSFKANIGIVDEPAHARQTPLSFDLAQGHLLIVGASGEGKTTLLRTLALSMATAYPPDALNMYMLDFGERGLRPLRDLPHVGAYITVSEGERIRRLLHRLTRLVDERKLLLSDAQVDSIAQYNATHPHRSVPSILVMIDNFIELKEVFNDSDTVLGVLVQLMRNGRSLGIHFAITVTTQSELPMQCQRLFTGTGILFLGSTALTEYYRQHSPLFQNYDRMRETIRYHDRDITLIPGRGFVYVEGLPLEFQAALPVAATPDEAAAGLDDVKKLAALTNAIRECWEHDLPNGIDILPSKIFLKHILPDQVMDNIPLVVGLADTDLEPASINLQSDAPHFLVVGPSFSGKTTMLRSLVMSLAHSNSVDRAALILVDFRQRLFSYGGHHTFSQLPHVLASVSSPSELRDVLAELKSEYQSATRQRSRDVYVVIDNYDDLSHALTSSPAPSSPYSNSHYDAKINVQAELAELARRYGSEGLHFVIGGPLTMLRQGADDLLRQIGASRYGLALDVDDSPSALGGRVRLHSNRYSTSYSSYYDAHAHFPPGRGFIVKTGQTSLVQIANPSEEDDPIGTLDQWIGEIILRNPQRANWLKNS